MKDQPTDRVVMKGNHSTAHNHRNIKPTPRAKISFNGLKVRLRTLADVGFRTEGLILAPWLNEHVLNDGYRPYSTFTGSEQFRKK